MTIIYTHKKKNMVIYPPSGGRYRRTLLSTVYKMTIVFGKVFGVIFIAIALVFISIFNKLSCRNTIYKTHILTVVSNCFL
jgi:hypothetical protein